MAFVTLQTAIYLWKGMIIALRQERIVPTHIFTLITEPLPQPGLTVAPIAICLVPQATSTLFTACRLPLSVLNNLQLHNGSISSSPYPHACTSIKVFSCHSPGSGITESGKALTGKLWKYILCPGQREQIFTHSYTTTDPFELSPYMCRSTTYKRLRQNSLHPLQPLFNVCICFVLNP